MRMYVLTILALAGLSLTAGDRGFLGVTLQEHHAHGKDGGTTITQVHQNSGAMAAGLQENDKILSINGVAIGSSTAVRDALDGTEAGQTVNLTFLRDGNEMDVDVVLGALPVKFVRIGNNHRKFAVTLDDYPYMGIDLMTLGDQLADFFQVENGVLVKEVVEGSPAEDAGIQAGDVIVGFDGVNIINSADLHGELSEVKPGDLVNLSLVRQGINMDMAVTLAERDIEHNFNFRFDFQDPQIKVLWDKDAAELHEHMGKLHVQLRELKEGQHEKLKEHHKELIEKYHYRDKKKEN